MARSVNTNADEIFMLQSVPFEENEEAIRKGLNVFISGDSDAYNFYIDENTKIRPHVFQEASVGMMRAPSVIEIGRFSFAGCNFGKDDVSFPNTTYVGPYAFAATKGLSKLRLDNIISLGRNVELVYNASTGSYVESEDYGIIEKNNGTIEYRQPYGNVFSYKDTCTHKALPSSAKYVEELDLKNLSNICFECFKDSKILKLNAKSSGVNVGPYAFSNSKIKTVSTAVLCADSGAFQQSDIENIGLTKCISIGYEGFYKCSQLKRVSLGNCKRIEHYAFAYSGLNEIVLYNVKEIGSYVFYGCTALENITLSDSISELGYGTFGECNKSIKSIFIDSATVISIKSDTFKNSFSDDAIFTFVSSAARDLYKEDEEWGKYLTEDNCKVVDCIYLSTDDDYIISGSDDTGELDIVLYENSTTEEVVENG